MPYILNKTNGTIVATVQDASLDITTDLVFVGKNYAGYGEWQNENFLRLLENFANTSAPQKPLEGQIWYNTSAKTLNAFDGTYWKSIANLEVSTTTSPDSYKIVKAGDLWFDDKEQQLHVYNGSEYRLVGPLSGADTRAQWKGSYEVSNEDLNKKYNIKAIVGINDEVVAVVSGETYTIKGDGGSESYPLYPATEVIKKGINLIGADIGTGISALTTMSGTMLWGTAAHSLRSEVAVSALSIQPSPGPDLDEEYSVPFVTTGTTSTSYYADGFTYNPYQNRLTATYFDGTATRARYADLAEKYLADAEYEVGTVVSVGGEKEITACTWGDRAIGVVSKAPAYLMNSELEGGTPVALKGRVPVKVIGAVRKGQRLIASNNGVAVAGVPHSGDVFAMALESNNDIGIKLIEAVIL